MNLKVVSNSTPLIALSMINRFDILKDFFGSLAIPEAVYVEVAEDEKNRAGRDDVVNAEWIRTVEVSNHLAVDLLSSSLDPGEAEAITLAKELDADLLLIDDKDGRKSAKSIGIPFTGTVGILLRYYRGDREKLKLALDELIARGFRLSKKEYEKILVQSKKK